MTRARDTAELAVTAAKASPTQNAITSTAYTAVLLDVGKTVTRSNAAAVGGGSRDTLANRSGSSGIVIIRYFLAGGYSYD